MPETTVLIPSFNSGLFIENAILSVLKQAYTDYEILIIDDGSTDNTYEIINKINDKRISYYKNQTNLGIVHALNIGLNLARGEYIARMDADDLMVGNRLEDQINFLKANPDHGAVGGYYKTFDFQGKILQNIQPESDNESIKINLLFRNQFAHSVVTMRSSIIHELKYTDNFLYAEDYDLWCRMSRVAKLANIPKYYLSYRWYDTNSCNLNQKQLKKSVVGILSRELDFFKIEHTERELALHAAINFGYAGFFFNTELRIKELNEWLDKIFSSKAFNNLSKEFLTRKRKEITRKYACIP